ncbi:MAG: D-2-hydroxyacid dehydrogenase [Balneolaceae bacterium]
MMKMVVLDGYTTNPGDLSWDGLEQFGELTIHDRTPADKIVDRCKDAEIVFTNKTPLSADTIKKLPSLKYIGVLATGYNVVDIEAAAEQGVVATNAAGYSTESVAQLTFSLILELCHRVQRHSDSVKDGKWARSADFCFWDYPLMELSGKTIGIIGFGTIGEQVADVATGFGMKVLGSKRTHTDQSNRPNFQWAETPELLKKSDVVSIHCPLTPETEGMINKKSLETMKRSAFLINTGRGPIVVEQDLADALNNGVIAGAGLDVLGSEPPPEHNPLFGAKNCLITPHIAWATRESRARLLDIVEENLSSFLDGNPVNVING